MLTRYAERNLTWIDLVSPTPAEVRSIMQEFAIDPLIAEELLMPSYKPKVERHGEQLYVILHFPILRGLNERPTQEIDFIIGKNFLITARYAATDHLHSFAKVFEVHTVLGQQNAVHGGHVFVAMVTSLYQALVNECDIIEKHLIDIEDRIFEGKERTMVLQISKTGRIIYDFRQVLLPHREMLRSLESAGTQLFGQEFLYYVHNVEGEYERVAHSVEHLRESLVELRETNNSLLSTKQNEVMKMFTVIAFLFLPLTFIEGLFQMNTHDTPILGTPGDFWVITGFMALLVVGFFVYFKRKGWL
ncbi:MAG: magnesium transporter CorA family protein [Minisyncoccia bacterium]|jgi:magnesium transporter